MKIKRTLPSITEIIHQKCSKDKKFAPQNSYEFKYNRNKISHIQVIDAAQKQENQKLANEILKHKPKIFKESLSSRENSDRCSSNQSTNLTERSTQPTKGSNSQNYQENEARGMNGQNRRAKIEKDEFFKNRANSVSEISTIRMHSEECLQNSYLIQDKIQKIQKTVRNIEKKLQISNVDQGHNIINESKSKMSESKNMKSFHVTALEKQREMRCQRIKNQNILLQRALRQKQRKLINSKFIGFNYGFAEY